MKAELEKHGLTMLGLNTPPGNAEAGEFGLACVPGREAEFATLFRKALDYVVAIGGRQIHVLAGKLPPEQRPAGETVFVRNLMQAADLAAEKNITLLIEPINARDRPGYFLNRVEHAADIIAKAERANIRIQFDFYHVQIVGGDLMRRFEAHFPVIGHVQVGAVPSRHEPDEGEVNYPEMFAMLDRLGYRGLCRSRIPAARAHRGRPRLGPAAWRRSEIAIGNNGLFALRAVRFAAAAVIG